MAAVSMASAAQAPIPACDRLTARPGALLDLDQALAWDGLESDASASVCDRFLRHWRPSASDMADAIYESGAAAFRDDDLDRAIRHFAAALAVPGLRHNDLAFLHSERGRALNQKGDFSRAIDDFTASLRHAPQDTNTLYRRGIAYWNAGEYDRSVADFTTAIRLDPEDLALYRERADAYRALDRLDRAMADLDRVLKSDPEDATAYRYRGAAHEREGKHDLAIEDYTVTGSLSKTTTPSCASIRTTPRPTTTAAWPTPN
jgi:tetratricopeptide (TPR) repeat protein